jgi:hypothetical protein
MTNKKEHTPLKTVIPPHPQRHPRIPSLNVIPHLMRDLFFMNLVTEMHSMLFLNEKTFVKLRSHDGRSPTINVGTQSPHQGAG